jgi:hypothetical protein
VTAYESAFTGGVRVAAADVNRDTYPDVVVAPGPGGGPRVRVLDGKTGEQIAGPLGNFFALEEDFTGGLSVAGADVNGDGYPDVIVAAGQSGGPRVRVFSGADGTVLADFFAFEPDFRGGMSVAAADVTGDGRAELVVGAGPGGGPRVRVLDLNLVPTQSNLVPTLRVGTQGPDAPRRVSADPSLISGDLGDFFAFPADLRTGVTVGTDAKAGDVTGDGVPDLLVGSGPGAAPTVRVYSGADGTLVSQFAVFDPAMTAGVRVASAFITDDAHADVIVATGPGVPNRVQVYDGASIVAGVADPGSTPKLITGPLADFAPFGEAFSGGVSVGASNDPPTLLRTETTTLTTMFGEQVSVVSKVYDQVGSFQWEYHVTNVDFTAHSSVAGVGVFHIFNATTIPELVVLDSPAGWVGGQYLDPGSVVSWLADEFVGNFIEPSETATFSFVTDPRPIGFEPADVGDPGYAYTGGGWVLGPQEKPTITLTGDTYYIPVNGNNTSHSRWQGGNTLTGLPIRHDFDVNPMRNLSGWDGTGAMPSGPPITDPELKKLTATVTGYQDTMPMTIKFTYPNATTGGRARLWADDKKVTEIALTGGALGNGTAEYTGTLPTVPSTDFYVEGIRPSNSINDIKITAYYDFAPAAEQGKVSSQKQLTITPVISEFSVNPKDPPKATFLRNAFGDTYGLSSGNQANGADRGSTDPGVAYTADVNRSGILGSVWYAQLVTTISENTASNPLSTTENDTYQFNPDFTSSLPLSDSVAGGPPAPLYPTTFNVNTSTRQQITSRDTPAFGGTRFTGIIKWMDIKFKASMYLVWKYSDDTIYTLAQADWQSLLLADQPAGMGLTISNSSIVTASPMTLTNSDMNQHAFSTVNCNAWITSPAFWMHI